MSAPDALHPIGHRIVRLDETPSTIDVAREFADDGAEHGTVVIADRQTSGRGRRGRTWATLPGKALAITAILRDLPDARHRGLAGIVAALSVVRAVEDTTGLKLRTKWPNDVVWHGKKLAGTLAEMHAGALLLSIGLNINGTEADIPEDIRDIASTLEILAQKPHDRDAVSAAVLRALTRTCHTLLTSPDGLIDAWDALDITNGREVTLLAADGEQLTGTSLGIDDEGRMKLKIGDAVRHIGEGDATVGK